MPRGPRATGRSGAAWQYAFVDATVRSPGTPSRRDRRAAVDLLVACLHEDAARRASICEAAGAVSPQALLDAAAYHAVGGSAHERLRDCDWLPASTRSALSHQYDAAVRQHLRATWEIQGLAALLQATGVRWALVKGATLVELVYGDPGLRPYADLDVIVDPAGFDRVLEGLGDAGLRPTDRNWTMIRRGMLGELHFVLPGGLPLDLHWHLVNMYRGRTRIQTSQLLERAERVRIGATEVPTFDATDALLHLALHGTLSGADRLRWMQDVAASARARPPDWERLAERARAWRIAEPVGFMLLRARKVLGAPVPEKVASSLLGRPYRALSGMIDRTSPWQDARGRLTAGSLLLTRSMALGPGRAATWLVARSLHRFDPREPARSSTATPSGGSEDYEAYVQAVVRGAGQER